MLSISDIGRMLIFFGIIMILAGLFFMLAGKIPHLGKLPGDITIHTKNLHLYFPLATSLIISILLTIIINLIFRHK
ncbi:MAG TPA: DUF2905 domain-containing protein [Candidatus Omnitrophota bacterium]|nr:DUF2905 domain-containing protein [Candidatus Omnitrophota bacterium]HPT39849.1 DUF2905 domain-containing protein [Candidatus Omnitrophota bacterium]